MIFGATKALYELNEERAEFEQRLKEGRVDPDELGPIALTASETLVAGYMARRANDNTAEVWASLDTMSGACRVSRSTVKRALARLCELGIIERAKKGGGHRSDTYRVLLGIRSLDSSRGSAVTPLDTDVKGPRGSTEISRGRTEDVQGVHSGPLYKRDTTKETSAPHSRASRSQVTVTEADAAIEDYFRMPPPRRPQSLPPLAQALIAGLNETAVGRMSGYERRSELHRLVKSAGVSRASERPTTEPVPTVDDDNRDDELAAELAADIAAARSRRATVERENSEIPV